MGISLFVRSGKNVSRVNEIENMKAVINEGTITILCKKPQREEVMDKRREIVEVQRD